MQAGPHAGALVAALELGQSPHGLHYLCEGVLVVRWLDVPDRDDVAVLERLTARLVDEGHAPFGVVQLLAADSGMPNAAVRSRLVHLWLGVGRNLGAMILVLGGDGFWAGAARAAINGMMFAAGRRAPIRVSGQLDEELPWLVSTLAQRRGRGPNPFTLRAELSRIEQLG